MLSAYVHVMTCLSTVLFGHIAAGTRTVSRDKSDHGSSDAIVETHESVGVGIMFSDKQSKILCGQP